MADKRVSVRLAVVGGREVRAELEGIGEAGERSTQRLARGMDAASDRTAALQARIRIAAAAMAAAFAAGVVTMVRSGLELIDSQAKLAQSIGTTVASVQTLQWAGELAGVSMGEIEQATFQLTRRLSEAAAGSGTAVGALQRLRLSAAALQALPVDQRIIAIREALERFVPPAERAAVASDLFGNRAALAFMRIDTATLQQATRDVADFGVAVSQSDAAAIEEAGDAIARLQLVWQGLVNQLTVAAAPVLTAIADGLAALARRSGVVGQAIGLLIDNIGRLVATGLVLAAFMAGRWVASLAAAALATGSLATGLVVLRGALARTGIGLVIVAAGELVYQFSRLVQGAGSFGEALALLGDLAREVWERMGLLAEVAGERIAAVWHAIRAAVLEALDGAVRGVVAFANRTVNLFEAALAAAIAIWQRLPQALGDLAVRAANALIGALERMLNAAVRGINRLLAAANAGLDLLGSERRIALVPEIDLPRIENRFAGAAARAGSAARRAFAEAFADDPFAMPEGLGRMAGAARQQSDAAFARADALRAQALAPLAALEALGEAMQQADRRIGEAGEAAAMLDERLEAIGGGGGNAGAAGGGNGGSAGREPGGGAEGSAERAGRASREAGEVITQAAEQAARGWAAVREELARYAEEAANWGKGLGQALTGALRSAEDAFARFVTTGKLDFRGLIDSILADLARLVFRQAVTEPLARMFSQGLDLGNLFGSLFGSIFHAGGVVGAPAPMRRVPALAFAAAPRLHGGGVAGLGPHEVPAILERGEVVLTRRQAAKLAGQLSERAAAGDVVINFNGPVSNREEVRRSAAQAGARLARMLSEGRRGV
ncbi:phage tail tape measure C-terminal domain-containing protein [Erythrobacter tepidarius]|uniref:phage tail tape measure C-terminal domain-containing protein n=1 Tax=Erythrobacter tepidarius TaxID=60454 RepID=UPI000A36FD44|nr:phage tail tape measure C-terminal domain-containing protein [Erythrobacter tepidarius]